VSTVTNAEQIIPWTGVVTVVKKLAVPRAGKHGRDNLTGTGGSSTGSAADSSGVTSARAISQRFQVAGSRVPMSNSRVSVREVPSHSSTGFVPHFTSPSRTPGTCAVAKIRHLPLLRKEGQTRVLSVGASPGNGRVRAGS
jgi:hypothetical protein